MLTVSILPTELVTLWQILDMGLASYLLISRSLDLVIVRLISGSLLLIICLYQSTSGAFVFFYFLTVVLTLILVGKIISTNPQQVPLLQSHSTNQTCAYCGSTLNQGSLNCSNCGAPINPSIKTK